MEGRSQHPRHVILTLERSPRFVYIVFLLSARSDSCAHLRRIYSQKEKRKFVRLVVVCVLVRWRCYYCCSLVIVSGRECARDDDGGE